MHIATAGVYTDIEKIAKTFISMLGEIARRSLAKAAQLNAELKAAASGDEASKEVAIQMLRKKAGTEQISYAYTLPQNEGGELISALLSAGQYEYKNDFSNTQLAIAATMMAADLITTAGFDPPTVFRKLDNFAKASHGLSKAVSPFDGLSTVFRRPLHGLSQLRPSDGLSKAVSERGTGFCDPFRMSMAPWFAEVARRNGVGFDKGQLAVYHKG